ncbi:MAG: site-2 protease family protein [Eubacteriales bacterium]|nr:site-2 protease family protein [Eubacteriales bacterium]MDD3198852.1 site-2 protease family protein [Eubacteriales bacterium]MDD4121658.1 site-2 protease family protein [Eubacteriales bacterium]MDD4629249.1 site-2 protease family protein [Eubacteriales bacterium]
MRFIRNNPLAVLFLFFMAYQSIMSGQMKDPMSWIIEKLIILPAILIGLSFHEFAHAFAADRLGDPTPAQQGRVTINPIAHVDFLGFLALIFIGFGWGKPVEVNPSNFKNMRRDNLIVDVAGVTINFILAIIFTGILRLLTTYQYNFINSSLGSIVVEMIFAIISINIVLMIFNLLPIPPLDGFGILTEVFNLRQKEFYYKIYDKGFIILLFLLIFNIVELILVPSVNFVYGLVMSIFF